MKIIGIIGAMPSELADIRKTLAGAAVKRYSGYVQKCPLQDMEYGKKTENHGK